MIQKALDARLVALEATSKIDITPQSATEDDHRPTYKDIAVPDAHKVAAITKEGLEALVAMSKIEITPLAATADESRRGSCR
jgi:hypothetical protein